MRSHLGAMAVAVGCGSAVGIVIFVLLALGYGLMTLLMRVFP